MGTLYIVLSAFALVVSCPSSFFESGGLSFMPLNNLTRRCDQMADFGLYAVEEYRDQNT